MSSSGWRRAIGADSNEERRWWVLGVVCLAQVLIGTSNSSLTVAIPTLVRDLHVSASGVQWVEDAYIVVVAGLLLTAGSLGDRLGHRLALNVGLAVFGAASAVAALSHSTSVLIGTRAIAGMGAAFVLAASLSIVAHVFPASERRRAIACWVACAGLGGVAGSLVGGWLLQRFWWGSVFVLNAALATVALVAGAFVLRSTTRDRVAVDAGGAVLSIAGFGALVYAIIEAPARGWLSVRTVAWGAVAAVVLVVLVGWERRARSPMLDIRSFRDRRFTAAALTVTLVYCVYVGTVFVLTQYLQLVLGYGPFAAGVRLVPWAVTYVLAAPLSARAVERWGHRPVLNGGLLLLAGGVALLSRTGLRTGYGLVAVSLVLMALGQAMAVAPAVATIVTSVPLRKAGVGSGVSNTAPQMGAALGVAVVGSLLTSRYQRRMARPPFVPRTARASIGAALRTARALPGHGAALVTRARSAYAGAFDQTTAVCAIGVLVTAVGLTWLSRSAAHVAEEEAAVSGGPGIRTPATLAGDAHIRGGHPAR
ncbi:MAG TPA: MFS transporter [Acidimicrobiales bacterium]|nr:MFS transporter [Acidimicrobiales bacterium]